MREEKNILYCNLIANHYAKVWKNKHFSSHLWHKGPVAKLNEEFRVLEFEPSETRKMWTYATCCMSKEADINSVEVHIHSSKKDRGIIEILTALAYYHKTSKPINLNHTVYFGKPWQDSSLSEFGLISLPYLDGEELETLNLLNEKVVKFYWLIPITVEEVEYKKKYGINLLEKEFDKGFNYLDPRRLSIV